MPSWLSSACRPDRLRRAEVRSDRGRCRRGGHRDLLSRCPGAGRTGASRVSAAARAVPALVLLAAVAWHAQAASISPQAFAKDVPRTADAGIPGPELRNRLASLAPGHWLEIPGSAMARVQVDACRLPAIRRAYGPVVSQPTTCDADFIMSFSGGAYDSKRHRMMVWGGGHAAYMGNELYAFDVAEARWMRVTEPSRPLIEAGAHRVEGRGKVAPSAQQGPTRGLGPISVHSYDQVEYLPEQDVFFAAGGSSFSSSGYATRLTWLFDLDRTDGSGWRQADPMPGAIYGLFEFALGTAYDPGSRRVIMRGYTQAGAFDPTTGSWTITRRTLPTRRLGTVAELDPGRRVLLVTGGGRSESYAVSGEGALGEPTPMETRGDREIEDCYAPGLAYSSKADRIAAWCGGGAVYVLDLDTATWTRHDGVPGEPMPADPNRIRGMRGTYGRFRYMPEYDAFILVNGNRANVFMYRLKGSARGNG